MLWVFFKTLYIQTYNILKYLYQYQKWMLQILTLNWKSEILDFAFEISGYAVRPLYFGRTEHAQIIRFKSQMNPSVRERYLIRIPFHLSLTQLDPKGIKRGGGRRLSPLDWKGRAVHAFLLRTKNARSLWGERSLLKTLRVRWMWCVLVSPWFPFYY